MAKARRGDLRIESLRVLGAIAVFLYHFMGDTQRVLQPPFADSAVWATLFHYSGIFGVSLFIVVSGIVFTWSWSRAAGPAAFIRRRLATVFPLYWWVAVPLILLALAVGRMSLTELWKVPFWLSGLGILSKATFFPVVDGWWYMTLALQMVLVFPFLRTVQHKVGLEVFLIGCAAVNVASVWALRALGMDYAVMGFVGSRLLELAVGMAIGSYLAAGVRGWPRASVLAAMCVSMAGCVLAWPWLLAQVTLGPAVVLLTLGIIANPSGPRGTWIAAAGALSFAFYLSHSPWAKPVLSAVNSLSQRVGIASLGAQTLLAGVLYFAVAVLIAIGFQASFLAAKRAFDARRTTAS